MSLENVYNAAIKVAKEHYENFPVVSFFLSAELIPHVAMVYKFARTADDIADEGSLPKAERLKRLEEFRNNFRLAIKGEYANVFWEGIVNTIRKLNLSEDYFFDLLEAFEQDINKTRYATMDELLSYCNKSANPIGRILLEMFNIRDEDSRRQSDFICTALQLTNMWQDISVDLLKGRIYLPKETITKFNVSEEEIIKRKHSEEFGKMMESLVKYTESLFYRGKGLLNKLPFKFKIQITATIYGGLKILKKIDKINFKLLNYKVKLNKIDYLLIFIKSLLTYE